MRRGLFNFKVDFEDVPIIRAKKKSKKEMQMLMEELDKKFN